MILTFSIVGSQDPSALSTLLVPPEDFADPPVEFAYRRCDLRLSRINRIFINHYV